MCERERERKRERERGESFSLSGGKGSAPLSPLSPLSPCRSAARLIVVSFLGLGVPFFSADRLLHLLLLGDLWARGFPLPSDMIVVVVALRPVLGPGLRGGAPIGAWGRLHRSWRPPWPLLLPPRRHRRRRRRRRRRRLCHRRPASALGVVSAVLPPKYVVATRVVAASSGGATVDLFFLLLGLGERKREGRVRRSSDSCRAGRHAPRRVRCSPRAPPPGLLLSALFGRVAVVVGRGRILVGRRGEGQVNVEVASGRRATDD